MVVIGGGLILSFDDLVFAQDAVALEVGQVAPLDILAPRSLQYESEELTEAKRAAAVVAVRPVYDPPDTSVASEQLQLARQILDYIDNVRHDDFASDEDHVQDLMAITAVTLDAQVIDLIMSISSDERWTAVDAQGNAPA